MKTSIIEDKQSIETIIRRCDICFIGITDLDGNPYVLPMNFGYEDGIIYLHSGPEGSKLEMLARNNNICVTFCHNYELVHQHPDVACSYSMQTESVICRGKVVFVENMDEKRRVLNIIMHHYTNRDFNYSDPAVRNVKIWQVKIDSMTGKIKKK